MSNQPLINILIRTSYRPLAFARCMESIRKQTYTRHITLVAYDDLRAAEYLMAIPEIGRIYVDKTPDEYGYNLYCNILKDTVANGWFFFLDDDDTLDSPYVLEQLSQFLTGKPPVIICQMRRGPLLKPNGWEMENWLIAPGKIGMPCIIMQAEHKNLVDFEATVDADYQYINKVTSQLPFKMIPLPLVNSRRRGHGYTE